MCGLIESNLDLCGIPEDETELILTAATAFLRRGNQRQRKGWDLVYFDPPYATEYLPVLDLLGSDANDLLADGGLVIVEHHHKNILKDELEGIIRSRVIKQGDSSLSFYERQSG